MVQKELLSVTPETLLWARESAGMDVEYVAKKMQKEPYEISGWENPNNEKQPTYAQLRKLAKIYKRPIVALFFLKPPREKDPAEVLRTRTINNDSVKLDKNMKLLFREAYVHLETLHELYDNETKENEFLKKFSEATRSDSKALARDVRNFLNVSIEKQKEIQEPGKALKFWRQEVEKHNIFIFKRKFNDKRTPNGDNVAESSFCGFCLHDNSYPIVYINNGNSKTRQIFTLFHEIAHLIYRVSGVDAHNSYALTDRTDTRDSKIERLCNSFAADFLVPDDDFNASIEGLKEIVHDDPRLEILSKEYNVSRNVILIKLHEREIIDRSFYEKQIESWISTWKKIKKNRSRSTGSDYYNNMLDQTSLAYAKKIFSSYYQKRISDYQLSDYLNIKIPSIRKFEEKLWK